MSIKGISDRQLFERLIEYLFENMQHGDMDVNTIASALALSPSQLNRRVKASTGIPASIFIMRTRLSEAKRMLADYPAVSIKEVALHCGFADSAHFGHVFRKYEGKPPTEYAKALGNQAADLDTFIRQQVAKCSVRYARRNIDREGE